jgi:hypothetical protein
VEHRLAGDTPSPSPCGFLTFLFERDPRPLITLLGLADDTYRCQREVKVKGGRLDLVVYRQPSNQPVAMLELKGASSKHDDQLDRYQAWAQKLDPAPKLFYCTLDGDDAPPIPWQPLSLATLFGAWQAVKDPHTAWLAHEITEVLRHWDAEAEGVIGAARGWYVPDLITRRTARALDELLRSAHPSDGEASASRTNTGNPMLTAWRRHPNGSDHARIAVDVRCNGRATPARPWLFRPCVDVSSAGRSEQAALIEAHDLAVTLQPAMLLPAIRDALTRREHPKLAEALRAEDHGGLAGPADPVVLASPARGRRPDATAASRLPPRPRHEGRRVNENTTKDSLRYV